MDAALARSAVFEEQTQTPRDRAGLAARPVRGPSKTLAFGINGRFLTKSVTGVQRYGREIVSALDEMLKGERHAISLFAPKDAARILPLETIAFESIGPGSGHAWEQCTLPLRGRVPLLNLCNTAPAFGFNRVVCIHDANVFLAPDSYGTAFRALYKTLQPWISRRSTFVTTVSRDAASKIAQFLNIPLNRITVVPNGHEHALRWDASRSKLYRTQRSHRPYILILGSLARHKNIGRIINLAGVLDSLGIDVKVVGGAAGIFRDEHWNSAPNVAFLGSVSDDDLAFLLTDALCLAFPSLSEGFGLPLLEAMVWGCPVVASNCSSIPEVCGEAALFADPNDDTQWVRHFTALADSKSLSDELRQRGLAQATKFSWAQSARHYLDMMERA
jgi:glycosyltransferase involved in cell wall biosynthesis